jgi:hypothetical protein
MKDYLRCVCNNSYVWTGYLSSAIVLGNELSKNFFGFPDIDSIPLKSVEAVAELGLTLYGAMSLFMSDFGRETLEEYRNATKRINITGSGDFNLEGRSYCKQIGVKMALKDLEKAF